MSAQMTSPVLKSAARLVDWMRDGRQIAASRMGRLLVVELPPKLLPGDLLGRTQV